MKFKNILGTNNANHYYFELAIYLIHNNINYECIPIFLTKFFVNNYLGFPINNIPTIIFKNKYGKIYFDSNQPDTLFIKMNKE